MGKLEDWIRRKLGLRDPHDDEVRIQNLTNTITTSCDDLERIAEKMRATLNGEMDWVRSSNHDSA